MYKTKRLGAVLLLALFAFASVITTSVSASADPVKTSTKRSDEIETRDQRIKDRFEERARDAYAKEHGVDDMSLIVRTGDSTCVSGNATVKDGVYRETVVLSYCYGNSTSSYYGDSAYEDAYLDQYVRDNEGNWVYETWEPVNIAGLTIKGAEFTLQDAWHEISFYEIKQTKPRKTRSLYVDDGDETYYSYRSRGSYVSSEVSGFEFYLAGEPTALIRRTKSSYNETCIIDPESGYCSSSGKG
jgi:hypothetical protein